MENYYNDNKALHFHLFNPLMEKIVRIKENNFAEKDEYDYAPQDFEDAMDNYEKVLEIMGEIAGEIMAPNAEEVDHEGPHIENNEVIYAKGTAQNLKALSDAQVVGMAIPRKYKGLNFPILPIVMSNEIVARADASFSNIWGLQDCADTLHEFASEEIKQKFLPMFCEGKTAAMDLTEPDAGSDLQAVQLKATFSEKDNCWYLDGVKRFITNGDADIALVMARSEEGTKDARGISLFVYDRRENKVIIRRLENKLGIKGSPTCELVFKHAPAQLVGERRMGLLKYVMSLMNAARLGVAAQGTGISEAAYRAAYAYAKEREQFGKAIIEFAPVYEMLAMMRAKIDSSRALLYETSRYVDIYKGLSFKSLEEKLDNDERNELKHYQRLSDIMTPLTKLFTTEYSNQVAYDAIQVLGGSGYMKDYPVERYYRDARITNIYEGTSQLQVVAAVKGVINGAFQSLMEDKARIAVKPELKYLMDILAKMQDQFVKTVDKIKEKNHAELLDFHARRLVEMAGHIISGYLLVHDANKEDMFAKSADIYVRYGRSHNIAAAHYISHTDEEDLSSYNID
ncbi:MAG: acyl-CoA dehydrogenase [Bacteroidetes bacterium GWF2_43_63]|nr:MAG: acyl-CoA dehydrogenase [Bacteroidetes bacterium GWE2_42_42]OFY55939.1 MAG: acyl-CoA dehydrogenase [Bacteroidetes bacterium GWF2_43_63]HCB61087.1 acyl-CoA dehydrogenase [Bacteroidales bacterium]HCY22267.1 acyl-CoA dehydrogenase [Bacteroidales bacterium]